MKRNSRPAILIINGPPAAGKTTLGKRLAADLRWPFIAKDAVKNLQAATQAELNALLPAVLDRAFKGEL